MSISEAIAAGIVREADLERRISALEFDLLTEKDRHIAYVQTMVALIKKDEAWRPIDSAPKDGSTVILYAPFGDGTPDSTYRLTPGYWDAPEHGRYIGDCGGECRCPEYADAPEPSWMSWDGGFCADKPPTHWKPLPDPPDVKDIT